MPYIPPEIVKKAKQIDALTYLQNYEPNELVSIGNGTFCTKTHDSLIISNGLWHWFSKGIGGKSAVDYLIEVEGYSFYNAVQKIINNTQIKAPLVYENNKKEQDRVLVLPQKAENNNKVFKYLMARGIDKDIIQECINSNLIYEEKQYHNVVFVGYDKNKNAKYAFCRATNNTRVMRDAKGSDKNYTFKIEPKTDASRLHLFESAIDLLSYATLMKLKRLNYKNEYLLSLAGVFKPPENKENIKIPGAIMNVLEQNPSIKEIHLHLDNDEVGRAATSALIEVLSKKYIVIDSPAPVGKDCNDYLCNVLKMQNFIKITNEKVSKMVGVR